MIYKLQILKKNDMKNFKINTSYLYLIPALMFVIGFIILPIIYVFILSFTDSDLLRPINFVGLKNYIRFFEDSIILESLKNTY